MVEKVASKYTLVLDDPAMYLDERGNPRSGRRLVFALEDDTRFEVTVTPAEYQNQAAIKAKLALLVEAHNNLTSL